MDKVAVAVRIRATTLHASYWSLWYSRFPIINERAYLVHGDDRSGQDAHDDGIGARGGQRSKQQPRRSFWDRPQVSGGAVRAPSGADEGEV